MVHHTRSGDGRRWCQVLGRSVVFACALAPSVGCNTSVGPETMVRESRALFPHPSNPPSGYFQTLLGPSPEEDIPAISSRGPFTLDIFMNDSNVGPMYHRSYNPGGWSAHWDPLPALPSPNRMSGQIASVSWSPDRIDVFGVDFYGTLQHNWANADGIWSPVWEPIGSFDCTTTCELAATSWGPNRLDVFVGVRAFYGDEGIRLAQVTFDNGWQAPAYGRFRSFSGIPNYIAATSWGPGRIDLVYSTWRSDAPDLAGDIQQFFTNDGANWSGPWTLGEIGNGFGGPSHASPIWMGLSTWGTNVLDVVAEFEGVIAQRSLRPTTGWDPGWSFSTLSSPISNSGNVSTVSWGPDRIDLVGIGLINYKDGQAYEVTHDWFNTGSGWAGTEPLVTPENCLIGWQNNTACAQPCLSRTQSDQAACVQVLNCYQNNFCGPSTCGTGGQVCGPNTLGFGNAPYPYAQQVFNCIPNCSQ